MFTKIKEFLFGKPSAIPEAPYKVETPAPVVQAPPVAEDKPNTPVKAKKAPAPKAPVAKKPRAKKSPAK